MARHFISRKEAADIMGLAPGTLANWRVRGVGPRCYNPSGGKALYLRDEIEKFVLGVDDAPAKPRRGRPPKALQRLAPA